MTTQKIEWLLPSTPESLLKLDAPVQGLRPKWLPPGVPGDVLKIDDAGRLAWGPGGGSDWVLNTEDFPGADLGARFNAALAVWAAGPTGGTVVIPPGVYTTATELVIPPAGTGEPKTLAVWAYGVTILTTGAISGLRIQTTARQTAVYGLRIEHYHNASAVYGFNLDGAFRTVLRDCVVHASGGMATTYAAVRIGFRTVGRQPSYWNTIENLYVLADNGSGTPILTGMLVEGASNVLRILRCDLVNLTTGIHFRPQPDGTGEQETSSPGSILIDGCDFEGVETGIQFDDIYDHNLPGGTRIVNNAHDGGTTFLALDPALTGCSAGFFLSGNRVQSNVTHYCTRGDFRTLMTLDGCETTPHLTDNELYGPVIIKVQDGSAVPLTIRPIGGNRGVHLETPPLTGFHCLSLTYQGALSTHHASIDGFTGGVPGLTLRGVKGITGAPDGIYARNFRGALTISGTATEGVVTLTDPETDSNYFLTFSVELSASAPGVAAWIKAGSKSTTGFTVGLSAAPGAGNSVTVNWIMVR